MYRTFVTLEELISLLIQRYLLFQSSIKLIATVDEKTREKICNVVVSYLIRVVGCLSFTSVFCCLSLVITAGLRRAPVAGCNSGIHRSGWVIELPSVTLIYKESPLLSNHIT